MFASACVNMSSEASPAEKHRARWQLLVLHSPRAAS
jgi:hypothetical protein